jgi:hypothetical protein
MKYDYLVIWKGRLFQLFQQPKGEEGLCKRCIWRNGPNKENGVEYKHCLRPDGFPSCPKRNAVWYNDPVAIWKEVTKQSLVRKVIDEFEVCPDED